MCEIRASGFGDQSFVEKQNVSIQSRLGLNPKSGPYAAVEGLSAFLVKLSMYVEQWREQSLDLHPLQRRNVPLHPIEQKLLYFAKTQTDSCANQRFISILAILILRLPDCLAEVVQSVSLVAEDVCCESLLHKSQLVLFGPLFNPSYHHIVVFTAIEVVSEVRGVGGRWEDGRFEVGVFWQVGGYLGPLF